MHEFFSQELEIDLLSLDKLAFYVVAHVEVGCGIDEQEFNANEDLDHEDDDEGKDGSYEAALEGNHEQEARYEENATHLDIYSDAESNSCDGQFLELEKMNGDERKEHHETVIELMRHSDELVFCLEQQEHEHVHFTIIILTKCFLVDSNEEPHANDVNEAVNVAHVLFSYIEISQIIEQAVDVK